MKAVWRACPKAVRIKYAKSPRTSQSLSRVVLVTHPDCQDTVRYIDFDRRTVDRISKVMPVGIGIAHPAYLRVVHFDYMFSVYCVYIDIVPKGLLLWEQPSEPEWLTAPQKN